MKKLKLEKLEKFQIKNQKLKNVLGGQGEPVQSFISLDSGQATGAGEMCFTGQCVAYSSDRTQSNGGLYIIFDHVVDKPC